MMRHLIRVVAVAGTTAALLAATALPALAVEQTLKEGNIKFGHGGVVGDGYRLYACDDRADGQGIRTEVTLNSGLTDFVSDPNGSQPGCGYKDTPGQYYATRYRVCMPSVVCTGWARAF
jgi:hypothetical protein